MKIKCQETETFQNRTNNFLSVAKGMENIIIYIRGYMERTSEYAEKLKALNSKYHTKQKANSLSPIEEFFRRLRIIVNAQITSLTRFNNMVDSEIRKCEKILSEQIECQKKFKKEAADAEEDYHTQIKEIEKAKRIYHSEASSLEDELRTFEKKRRGSFKHQFDDEYIVNINGAIKNMIKAEKEYTKKFNKNQRFKQTFLERIFASTGSTQQLFDELEKIGKETVVNSMLYLKMAGKELIIEIETYSLHMEKPILLEQNDNNPQLTQNCLADLVIEPYKLKLLTNEQNEDLSEEEIHNVIKTMYENMRQKAIEVIININNIIYSMI